MEFFVYGLYFIATMFPGWAFSSLFMLSGRHLWLMHAIQQNLQQKPAICLSNYYLGLVSLFFFFVYSSLFCTMFGCIITSVVQCKRLACISRNIWWRLTKQSSGIQLLTWVFIALLIRNGKGRCQGRLFCGKRTVNSSVLLLIIKR